MLRLDKKECLHQHFLQSLLFKTRQDAWAKWMGPRELHMQIGSVNKELRWQTLSALWWGKGTSLEADFTKHQSEVSLHCTAQPGSLREEQRLKQCHQRHKLQSCLSVGVRKGQWAYVSTIQKKYVYIGKNKNIRARTRLQRHPAIPQKYNTQTCLNHTECQFHPEFCSHPQTRLLFHQTKSPCKLNLLVQPINPLLVQALLLLGALSSQCVGLGGLMWNVFWGRGGGYPIVPAYSIYPLLGHHSLEAVQGECRVTMWRNQHKINVTVKVGQQSGCL